MQRRVAAIYFVFFLVVGASAYSVIALAEPPSVEVSGDTYSQNDTFTEGGQEYTVSSLQGTSGELSYTNESYVFTETLGNNSTVNYSDARYRVLVDNSSQPPTFTLRQEFNVSQILANDSAVYNETTTIEGEEYVTYRENNTNRLLSEYLPERDSQQFGQNDTLQYQGNETRVAQITAQEVTLEWTGASNQTIELSEGGNVTLGGTQYFAHFSEEGGNARVTLAETGSTYPEYSRQVAQQNYFGERVNGLWGVVILAGLAALLVVSMALMPVKG